jgi:AcrR family transcriptional regulator
MVRAVFNHADFFDAALALAAEHGPSAVTVSAITARLGAPTGSFYHRFVSRNALLGALWLRTVLDFQVGVTAALDANDGLQAALHTPIWAREHLDAARLLLLYDRDDLVQGDWPKELRERVAEMTNRMEASASRRARVVFGRDGPEEAQLSQFLIASLPVAAVRQYLIRREPPPALVDRLIGVTYAAVVSDYQARRERSLTSDRAG